MALFSLFLAVGIASVQSVSSSVIGRNSTCKCMPGDLCWPSSGEWDSLNQTLGGGLIATEPLGSPCHDPNYDEAVCNNLKANWNVPIIQ